MGENSSRTKSPAARAARGPAFRWLGVLVSWWFKSYSGMRSFWPTLIRSGLSSWSRLASKIFMYMLALP